ncbi:MAG: M50 family metallopeptidase [Eubacteriales bacterium]|nr:M50 family metallopeptidase [Eubacteriales bacterium]
MKSWVICRVGGCAICMHPLFIVALLAAAITGYGNIFMLVFAVVLAHEMCHTAVAAILRYEIVKVELMPFGGVATLEGLGEGRPSDEAIIALAGPLGNMLLITAALALDWLFALPEYPLMLFVSVNATMGVFNLLPALPLDGGRVLRSLLARPLGPVKATRAGALAGMVLAVALAAYGVWGLFFGIINLSVFLVAIFLLIAAVREYRRAPYLLAGIVRGSRRHTRPVNHLAAAGDETVSSLVHSFLPGMYNVVTVLDEEGQQIGELTEEAVLRALQKGTAAVQAGQILR